MTLRADAEAWAQTHYKSKSEVLVDAVLVAMTGDVYGLDSDELAKAIDEFTTKHPEYNKEHEIRELHRMYPLLKVYAHSVARKRWFFPTLNKEQRMSVAVKRGLEKRIESLGKRLKADSTTTVQERIAAMEAAIPFLMGRQKSAFEKTIAKDKESLKSKPDTRQLEKELADTKAFYDSWVRNGPDYNATRAPRGSRKKGKKSSK